MPEIVDTLVFSSRFNGPPNSANGGYACGRISDYIKGPVSVRLHAPPPLDKELQVVRDGPQWFIRDGEQVLLSAQSSAQLELSVPRCPSAEALTQASALSISSEQHIFPHCFVCGTERKPDEALCLHVGPCEGSQHGLQAGYWQVHETFEGDDGLIAPRYLWSALDCPSAYAVDIKLGILFLLGSLEGQIYSRPAIGERCRVLAWPLSRDGRKHYAATAIFGAEGQLHALSKATWIELK